MTDETTATERVGADQYKRKATVSSWVYVGIISVVAMWQISHHGSPEDWIEKTKLNSLGDFLAGVFAPIAFIWVAVAVFIQSNELALQREELALTRDEYKENRKVLEQQAKAAQEQAENVRLQHAAIIEQSELQRLVAQANYKVTLFQERFLIYQILIDVVGRLYGNVRFDTMSEIVNHIQKIKFVFGSKVYDRGKTFFFLVASIRKNIEYYEKTFGKFPYRNDDGELTFVNNGPDDEQEMRVREIEDQLEKLLEEATKGDLTSAMRDAMELDSDIDIERARLKQDQHGNNN